MGMDQNDQNQNQGTLLNTKTIQTHGKWWYMDVMFNVNLCKW
jgi:hypothetical protein